MKTKTLVVGKAGIAILAAPLPTNIGNIHEFTNKNGAFLARKPQTTGC
jgi:hypothetical protein